jgi:hypothetical protein
VSEAIVIAIHVFALVAALVFVAAFLAYVGILLGANVPTDDSFRLAVPLMWDPFKAQRQRRRAAETIARAEGKS